jgi:hypothetical protein
MSKYHELAYEALIDGRLDHYEFAMLCIKWLSQSELKEMLNYYDINLIEKENDDA